MAIGIANDASNVACRRLEKGGRGGGGGRERPHFRATVTSDSDNGEVQYVYKCEHSVLFMIYSSGGKEEVVENSKHNSSVGCYFYTRF